MGGLRRYLPVTYVFGCGIATLAISACRRSPGFFSKGRDPWICIRPAQGSTLASASWLGIPGSTLLYSIYVIGLITALLTAIYMTRMMLYTFHGPNRTGGGQSANPPTHGNGRGTRRAGPS